MSITNAVSAMTGVGQVEADSQNRTVTVTHDENASAETIIAKIEEIGFEARV
jgi:copper chaperone CopZ